MAKPELGTKRTCPSCAAKFYDLGRRPARCPKCETEFDPELEDPRLKAKAPEPEEEEAPKKQPDTSDGDGYGDEDDDTPEVDAEADRLEHAISEDFEDRIDRALGSPIVGAPGEPIPSKEGDMAVPQYLRLSELSDGDRARIREVSDRDPEMLRYLHQQGLVLGARVEVQGKAPFSGPMMLTIGSNANKHIGMEVAASVFVDLEPAEASVT